MPLGPGARAPWPRVPGPLALGPGAPAPWPRGLGALAQGRGPLGPGARAAWPRGPAKCKTIKELIRIEINAVTVTGDGYSK